MEPKETVLDPKAREAVHAARDAAHAIEMARQAQVHATEKIEQKLVDEGRMAEIVHEQVTDVLSRGTESQRAIILARVPYICADITTIKKTMENTDAKLDLIAEKLVYVPMMQKLVFGLVSIILVAVAGALMGLVIIK